MSTFNFFVKTLDTIHQVPAQVWDELVGDGYPFLRWHFLSALEDSGDVSAETGWQVQHLTIWHHQVLIGVMPAYLKTHSHGEYVFDQSWANAYHQHGFVYYPKWVSAIPFTPCEGPRLSLSLAFESQRSLIFKTVLAYIEQQSDIPSWHCLFPQLDEIAQLPNEDVLIREAIQFQWFNQHYTSFDQYLSTFKSKYRKNLKRERRSIAEQGIVIKPLIGHEIDQSTWQVFFDFYRATYYKRGMNPYLSFDFFQRVAASMPEQLLMVVAEKQGKVVATALSFIGAHTLYGRYWGCFEAYNNLHFELCYYQGIEYCISHQLSCFNSGAQGEHKISRGFAPVKTYSLHWIRHLGFKNAIADFLHREKEGVELYRADAKALLPFNVNH